MSTWLTRGDPVVSICCATYNHVGYIEDALRGFVAQVTSFPFEIIVRDDASSDGTADIVRRYAEAYPHIVRPVLEQKNQYSQGVRATPVLVNLARGEYLALCEGDDYWITNDKLEKQVQLLREHPESSMCVARTVRCKNDERQQLVCQELYQDNGKDLQRFEDIQGVHFHTSTYLIRTHIYRDALNQYSKKIQIGDYATRFMLVAVGPFALLKETVSVYRDTGHGMWSSLNPTAQMARLLSATEGYYRHFDNADYRRFFGLQLFTQYRWMFLNGTWSFNHRSAFANLGRFLYFAFKYGVPRSAMARWFDKPVQAMGFLLKRCLPDRYWKYLQSLWRKLRQ